MLWMSIQYDAIPEPFQQRTPKALTQRADAGHRLQIHGERRGGSESDCEQRAFGAGTPAMFVPGAVDQGFELDFASVSASSTPRRT